MNKIPIQLKKKMKHCVKHGYVSQKIQSHAQINQEEGYGIESVMSLTYIILGCGKVELALL